MLDPVSNIATECIFILIPFFTFWQDRKMIIKSFKNFVLKICKEEFGHRALMALFDCVDDTKIVSKVVIDVSTRHMIFQLNYFPIPSNYM